MKTPEMRKSQIKGFLRLQEQLGGIRPSLLKDGEVILVETNEYIYRLKVKDSGSTRRFLLQTGAPSCQGNNVVIDIRAHSTALKYEMPNWIGKDMRLILKFSNGSSILIGEVSGASVSGRTEDGKEYTYEFWEEQPTE